MAIKFRCRYCRQLLGIGDSRAGALVSCPRCRRKIRVPVPEGLAAASAQQLDLSDPTLVQALDELACLGTEISSDFVGEQSSCQDDALPDKPQRPDSSQAREPSAQDKAASGDDSVAGSETLAVGEPADEPQPIELPPLPTQPVQTVLPEGTADEDLEASGRAPEFDLAVLGEAAVTKKPVQAPSLVRPQHGRLGWVTRLSWSVVLLTIGAVAGFLSGREFVRNSSATKSQDAGVSRQGTSADRHQSSPAQPSTEPVSRHLNAADSSGSNFAGPSHSSSKPTLSTGLTPQRVACGTVVYETESGTQRPDHGAKVLALPLKRSGSVRLSVVGFRPGDDPLDFKVARAAFVALGGAATTVDAIGHYSLSLPTPGPYLLLVLSRYQAQADGQTPSSQLLSALKTVFLEPPARLLGRTAFATHFVPENSPSLVEWNCVFARP